MKLSELPSTDWAYAAGIVDGEGCILIGAGSGYDRKGRKYTRYVCQLRVGTTSKDLADWLRNTFSGGVYFRKSQSTKWKDQHHWVVGASNLRDVLLGVFPYLKLKKEQALLALEYLENKQKNDPAWRQSMKEKMNLLNKKGKPVETTTPNIPVSGVKIESELAGDCKNTAEMSVSA